MNSAPRSVSSLLPRPSLIWKRRKFEKKLNLFLLLKLHPLRLAALQMMNAHLSKPAFQEAVSILALRTILAVHLQSAQWQTTELCVHALLGQQAIPTQVALQVSWSSMQILLLHSWLSLQWVPVINLLLFSTVKIGECDTDAECPDNKACNQHQCINPCENGLPCGKNAQCTATGHRAVCKCPTGWGGDPSTECYQCK